MLESSAKPTMNISMLPIAKDRVLEEMKVNDGVLVVPFPEDDGYQSHGADGGHDATNKVRAEPVVALPFIEHDLQRAKAERQQPETNVINAEVLAASLSSYKADR